MIDFKKFERLSKTEYGIIRDLLVEEGLVDNSQIEQIVERVTKDRFNLGKAKIEFARKLDVNDPEACIDLFFRMAVLAKKYKKVIIALCYAEGLQRYGTAYAMYQACRAAVFHTHRNACLE